MIKFLIIFILIGFLFSFQSLANAQSGSIYIKIDKHAYEIGDQIIFSGDIGTIVEGRSLYIFLNDPDGKWMMWMPFIAPGYYDPDVDRYFNEDGSFSGVTQIENYFDRCGSYKISLVYSSTKISDYEWDSPPTLAEALFTVAGPCEPKCGSGEILENGVCVSIIPEPPTPTPTPSGASVPMEYVIVGIVIAAVAAGIGIALSKRKKTSVIAAQPEKYAPKTKDETQFWVCPVCGKDTKELHGKSYCDNCQRYL